MRQADVVEIKVTGREVPEYRDADLGKASPIPPNQQAWLLPCGSPQDRKPANAPDSVLLEKEGCEDSLGTDDRRAAEDAMLTLQREEEELKRLAREQQEMMEVEEAIWESVALVTAAIQAEESDRAREALRCAKDKLDRRKVEGQFADAAFEVTQLENQLQEMVRLSRERKVAVGELNNGKESMQHENWAQAVGYFRTALAASERAGAEDVAQEAEDLIKSVHEREAATIMSKAVEDVTKLESLVVGMEHALALSKAGDMLLQSINRQQKMGIVTKSYEMDTN